jgi:drug/metabolite transporter (DMT)-like permease
MSDEALLSPGDGAPGIRIRHILVVLVIAASQTTAAQIGAVVVHAHSAAFLVWFSTGFNVLLALPLLADRETLAAASARPLRVAAAFVRVLPFYVLWMAANVLYVQALAGLEAALVSALFSVTPSLVALLSVPLLRRPLTILALVACTVSAGGIALIWQPWNASAAGAASTPNGTGTAPPASPPAPAEPSAFASAACVLGASVCAALYKVPSLT